MTTSDYCDSVLTTRTTRTVGRRSVLIAVAVTTGTACLGLLQAAPARAADPEVTIEAGGDLVEVATADGAVVQVPTVLGGLLSVGSAPLPEGTEVRVTWDPRLYEANPAPVLTVDGEALECSYSNAPSGTAPSTPSSAPAQATVVLGEALPQGRSYLLCLGSTRSLTYPQDTVEAPEGTSITVSLPAGPAQAQQEAQASGTQTTELWGASVGAGWQMLTWGEGYHVWYPGSVTLRSAGPAPVPAGSRLTVQADAQVLASLVLGQGADAVTAVTVGTVLSATYTTPGLTEGQMLTLPVTVEARDLDGPLDHLEPTVVTVSSPEAARTQRSTGWESVSRADDAYDEATRLRYGVG
ncbi:hypothetical protein D4740_07250 [Actinomyces sp. 2119]|uniref:hypothetical protein n=1 Tax=Actinomyces sp. 2119 TaxID=2321393 RepID=UPI000E6B617C|nr:hypothetical protein [Actinomyces sp. 2119]RJF41872.1 hypothetical protein D4740_07250 [Actinomyces sp. 2119]